MMSKQFGRVLLEVGLGRLLSETMVSFNGFKMQVIVYQNTSWDLCFLWSGIKGAFMLKSISTV